ncbi:MAG: VOC family protein [Gemmatimonadota bacterium]
MTEPGAADLPGEADGVAIDHLLYGTPDLSEGIDRIERLLGVRPVPGGRHPQYGTRNALAAIGPSCYLEVMAPDPSLPAPERGVLFGLPELSEPRLVSWVLRRKAIDEVAAAAGLGPVSAGRRERDDGTVVSWRLSDPYADRFGGVVPFLIDWGETPHPANSAPPAGELVRLRLEHPAPDRVRSALRVLGVDVTEAPDGRADIDVTPGEAPRLAALIRLQEGAATVELH